jgi:protein O-mannosyl-transferase
MRRTGRCGSSWPVAIVLLGILAYLPSLEGVFVFDDLPWILDNEDLQHLWPPWAAARGTSRPLLFFTLALNHAISGLQPWSYHVANLGIHLGTALLLFGVLRRSLCSERVAASLPHISGQTLAGSTALLWVVHPLTTQAVTYVIQRGESLASLLMVLSIYALVRSRCRGTSAPTSERVWWALVVVSWWAAMATKEIAVTLPVLLVLFDGLVLTGCFETTWRERRHLYLALWLPIGLGIISLLILRPQHLPGLVRGDAEAFGRIDYLISQPGVILQYLRMTIWPRGLQVDHGWPVASLTQALVPILMAFLAIGVTLVGLVRRRPWSFGGIWFLCILAPTSSLVPLRDLLVEHRMYLPLVAPLFGLSWLVANLRDSRVRWGILGLAVCILGLTTAARNRDYHSELALWAQATGETHNARRFYNLQLEFVVDEGGVLDGPLLSAVEAAADLRPAARALQSGDAAGALQLLAGSQYPVAEYPAAANLRGLALWMSGHTDQAVTQWNRPDALPAARANLAVASWLSGDLMQAERLLAGLSAEATNIPEVYYNLGTLWARLGRLSDARQPLQRALALRPTMAAAMNNLGAIEEGLGLTGTAIVWYDQALARDHETGRLNRGLLHVRQRYYKLALPLLDRLMEVRPDARTANARALARYFTGKLEGAAQDLQFARQRGVTAALDNNLGCVQMALGDLEGARRLFESALSQAPAHSAAHHNLGKLLVSMGQPERAIEHLRQAARARPDDAGTAANLAEAERLSRR